MKDPESLQRAYYARTAATYDHAHLREASAHDVGLSIIAGLARSLAATSIVDVGAGTGRGVAQLGSLLPGVRVQGFEPVAELVAEGHKKGIAADALLVADGRALPLADASVDIAIATGVLHHVPRPVAILDEMMRVARRAVFVSDANRFAQGSLLARAVKLGLWSTGLWRAFDFVRTRGKGYMESEGDGVFFSYSVFDDLPRLAAWGERTLVVPLDPDPRLKGRWVARVGPLVIAPTVLVGALR